ncbi:hypothetical protein FOZ60_017149, partial [Perkinsus olseni]
MVAPWPPRGDSRGDRRRAVVARELAEKERLLSENSSLQTRVKMLENSAERMNAEITMLRQKVHHNPSVSNRPQADEKAADSEGALQQLRTEKAEAEKKAADSEEALQQLRTEKAEAEKKAADSEEAPAAAEDGESNSAEAEKKAADSEEALQKLRVEKDKAIKNIEAKLLEANVQHADSLVALQRSYEQQTRDAAGEQTGTEVFDELDVVPPTVAVPSPRASTSRPNWKSTLFASQSSTASAAISKAPKRKIPATPATTRKKRSRRSAKLDGVARMMSDGSVGFKIDSKYAESHKLEMALYHGGNGQKVTGDPEILDTVTIPPKDTLRFAWGPKLWSRWLGPHNDMTLRAITDHNEWCVIPRFDASRACQKRVKMVNEGEFVQVLEAGEHSNVPRERRRARHPVWIIGYIVERITRMNMTASEIFASLADDHREYVLNGRITRDQEYRHTFVPFFMAIIDKECYDIYYCLLDHLDTLIKALTNGEKTLADVVNFCVHDAHQGALRACEDRLPGIRNGRCYFHLSKNLKDNQSLLAEAFSVVKRHKYWLHASCTDALYNVLASALIRTVEGICQRGAEYLRTTLDVQQYGYPNIALTREGLEGTQVINALKMSSPQHFVKRPEPINLMDYGHEMRLRGTKIHQRGLTHEVTETVSEIMEEVQARYFVVENHRCPPNQAEDALQDRMRIFLRGILSDDFPRADVLTLEEVMSRYFCFYLVSTKERTTAMNQRTTTATCTCKEYRDWGCCSHTYAVEIHLGTKPQYIPDNRQLPRLRRGRPTQRRAGALGRFHSAVTAADSEDSDSQYGDARGAVSDGDAESVRSLTESSSNEDSETMSVSDTEESGDSVAGN